MNVRLLVLPLYLKNLTTNFDKTLHVAQAWPKEGFKIVCMPRYPLDWQKMAKIQFQFTLSKMSGFLFTQ